MHHHHLTHAMVLERQSSLLTEAEAGRSLRSARQGPRRADDPRVKALLRRPRSLRRQVAAGAAGTGG